MKRWEKIHFEQSQTIMTLLCSEHPDGLAEALSVFRRLLEEHIQNDPEFEHSHVPIHRGKCNPALHKMLAASALAGVGPMAAVAGAFTAVALDHLKGMGIREAVVDNGGDIGLIAEAPVYIGIFSGRASPFRNLAFKVLPTGVPLGICTSSGTVGHSFSYGSADAAIVISHNIELADAAATALGNRIRNTGDLENCFDFMNQISDIQGAVGIIGDRIAMWGELPELCEIPVDDSLITRGRL